MEKVPLDVAVSIMARDGTVSSMIFNKQWREKSKDIVQTPTMLHAYLIEVDEAYTDAVKLMRVAEKMTDGKAQAVMVAVENGHATVVDLVFRSVQNPSELIAKFDKDLAKMAMHRRDVRTMGSLYKHGVRLKDLTCIWKPVMEDWEDVVDWLLKHDERTADMLLYQALCEQKMKFVWKALEANADVNVPQFAARCVVRPCVMQLMHDLGIDVASGYEGAVAGDDVEMVRFLIGLGVIPTPPIYTWIGDSIDDGVGHSAILEVIAMGAPFPASAVRAMMTGGQVPLAECVWVFAEAGARNVTIAYPLAVLAGDLAAIDALIEYGIGPYGVIDADGWRDILTAENRAAVMKVRHHFPRAVPRDL